MGNIQTRHFAETKLRSDQVNTECGPIVGKRFEIGEGKYADAFLGIPFAAPPVGNLRYQKPQPHSAWKEPRMCIVHGPRGPQKSMFLEKIAVGIPTSEDSLYLNVFAPAWEKPKDQPNGRAVMVFIHGGGFAMHTSANYGDLNICRYLCSKEVVVVTIQYRLGLLGFMATGDDSCIPNLGLWDQAFALKWVKNNIAQFGGNPENITLFGQSAGAASADMLSLSPHSRTLFSKVIVMGGSASCGWATSRADLVREAAIEHAKAIGWKCLDKANESEMNKSLMQFLRTQPSTALSLGIIPSKKSRRNPYGLNFVPVIDGDFFPKSISELRRESPAKLCMAGTTDYEALMFAALAKSQFSMKTMKMMIPARISKNEFTDYEELRKKALGLYIRDGQTGEEKMRSYIRLFSDLFINNGVHEFAEDMVSAGHQVYLYNFEYCNPATFGVLGWMFPFKAATHAMELPFLFGKGLISKFKPSFEDAKVINSFATFFTNFAKYGDPNGSDSEKIWQPLTASDTFKYLSISNEISMKSDYQGRRAEFWRQLETHKRSDFADGEDITKTAL